VSVRLLDSLVVGTEGIGPWLTRRRRYLAGQDFPDPRNDDQKDRGATLDFKRGVFQRERARGRR